MRSSVPRGSPARAQETRCLRWKSPTLTASASPWASRVDLGEVQTPMPGMRQRGGRGASPVPSRAGGLEPGGVGAGALEGVGPPLLDADHVEVVVAELGDHLAGRRCSRRPPGPGAGSPQRSTSWR